MLSKRTALMTATGLLTGYLATAQSSAPTSASPGADLLFWLLAGVLGLVLLLVVVAGGSLASAARQQAARPETPSSTSTTPAPEGPAVC